METVFPATATSARGGAGGAGGPDMLYTQALCVGGAGSVCLLTFVALVDMNGATVDCNEIIYIYRCQKYNPISIAPSAVSYTHLTLPTKRIV